MIREAFRSVLLADSAVSTAVGGTRIYPLQVAQGVREPSLVYQRVSGLADILLDGPQSLRETRLQLDAWALDPDDAAALMHLAETRLHGFSGVVSYGEASPQAQMKFHGVFLDGERDGYDPASQLYRDGRDFRILWKPV